MSDHIQSIRRRWGRLGGIARDFAVVGGATAIAQGAVLLAAPVLARLYAPADFGLLAVFAALLAALGAIAALRFDLAIPIATDRSEAVRLFVLANLVAVCASLGVAGIVLVWGNAIAVALGAEALAPLLWLLPVALFLACFTQSLASWAAFTRTFSSLGRMRVAQGLTQAGGQVTLGFLQLGAVGLIVGDVVSRIVGAGQLSRSAFAAVRATRLTFRGLIDAARVRWPFARVMTAASLLTALSLQAPFLVIPAFFDLGSSGQYFLALRTLALPASFVATAIGQVFFGEASHRRVDPENLHDLARDTATSLFVFALPTYGVMLVAGQAVIVTVFGDEWQLAGLYAQIMAPSLILWTVANPLSSLPLVGGRERESLLFTVAELGLRLVALAIGVALDSLTLGIVFLAISSVAIEGAAIWRFLRVAGVTLGELLRPAARTLASTAPFLAALLVVAFAWPAVLLAAAIAAWIGAFGLSVRSSREARALLTSHYG